jgi:hypothetical protein
VSEVTSQNSTWTLAAPSHHESAAILSNNGMMPPRGLARATIPVTAVTLHHLVRSQACVKV